MNSRRGPQPGQDRDGLAYLDGLRWWLAITVVVYHVGKLTGRTGELADAAPWLDRLLSLGEGAVPVFIVLSGFSLMISVARRGDLRLRGGWLGHLRRRSRRLLPPYLAALVISIALIVVVPLLGTAHGTQWDQKIPLSAAAIVSHVFLVHNLDPDLIGLINGSLWSIAVEWQITLAMPLLLLVWRRVGAGWVLAGLLGLGVASTMTGVLAWSAPFFPFLFGLGMYAAYLTQGPDEALGGRRGAITTALFHRHRATSVVITAALLTVLLVAVIRGLPYSDVIVGCAAAALIALAHERFRLGYGQPAVASWLGRRTNRRFGLASYSVYLLHMPLVALGNLLLLPVALPAPVRFAVLLVAVVPVTLVCCWAFYRCVERRFLTTHQGATTRTGPVTRGSRSRRTSGSPATTVGR